jgi:hypothetical protein
VRTSTEGCGPFKEEEPEDPSLVGRELRQDPLVGEMGVLAVADVARTLKQRGALEAQRVVGAVGSARGRGLLAALD